MPTGRRHRSPYLEVVAAKPALDAASMLSPAVVSSCTRPEPCASEPCKPSGDASITVRAVATVVDHADRVVGEGLLRNILQGAPHGRSFDQNSYGGRRHNHKSVEGDAAPAQELNPLSEGVHCSDSTRRPAIPRQWTRWGMQRPQNGKWMDCSATIASTPSTKHAGMVTSHTRRRTILTSALKALVHARAKRRCGSEVRGGERHLQYEPRRWCLWATAP